MVFLQSLAFATLAKLSKLRRSLQCIAEKERIWLGEDTGGSGPFNVHIISLSCSYRCVGWLFMRTTMSSKTMSSTGEICDSRLQWYYGLKMKPAVFLCLCRRPWLQSVRALRQVLAIEGAETTVRVIARFQSLVTFQVPLFGIASSIDQHLPFFHLSSCLTSVSCWTINLLGYAGREREGGCEAHSCRTFNYFCSASRSQIPRQALHFTDKLELALTRFLPS